MQNDNPIGAGPAWRASAFERHHDAAVASPRLAELARYWQGQCIGGDIPAASAVDPLQIGARLLPHVILVDVDPDGSGTGPQRFRFRLVGTYVVGILGRDNTGRYFEDCYGPERLEDMTVGLRWVMQNRAPMRSSGTAEFADRGWLNVEFLLLPLAGSGGTVDRVMMGLDARPMEAS